MYHKHPRLFGVSCRLEGLPIIVDCAASRTVSLIPVQYLSYSTSLVESTGKTLIRTLGGRTDLLRPTPINERTLSQITQVTTSPISRSPERSMRQEMIMGTRADKADPMTPPCDPESPALIKNPEGARALCVTQ